MQKKPYHGTESLIKIIRSILIVSLVISFTIPAPAQKDLDVIKDNWLEYSDAPNSLYHHLTDQCYDLLDKRKKSISQLETLPAWQERQKFIRETLLI